MFQNVYRRRLCLSPRRFGGWRCFPGDLGGNQLLTSGSTRAVAEKFELLLGTRGFPAESFQENLPEDSLKLEEILQIRRFSPETCERASCDTEKVNWDVKLSRVSCDFIEKLVSNFGSHCEMFERSILLKIYSSRCASHNATLHRNLESLIPVAMRTFHSQRA